MKSAIFLAEGFEICEALIVVDLLRRANLEIDMISMGNTYTVKSAQQVIVQADKLFQEIECNDYECLILPGGKLGTRNLENDERLLKVINVHYLKHKLICAICAAPSILGHMDILKGRHYTCFPSFQEDKFQGFYEQTPVVKDVNIITGKGMGATIEFAREMIRTLADEETLARVEEGIQYIHCHHNG